MRSLAPASAVQLFQEPRSSAVFLTLTAEYEKPAGVLRDPRLHVPGESVGACFPRIWCRPRGALTRIAIGEAQANNDLSVAGSGLTVTRSARRSFTTRSDREHRFDIPLGGAEHYWRCDDTAVESIHCGGQFDVARSPSEHRQHRIAVLLAVDEANRFYGIKRFVHEPLSLDEVIGGIGETVGHRKRNKHGGPIGILRVPCKYGRACVSCLHTDGWPSCGTDRARASGRNERDNGP